jgi:hypothetical protein
MNIIRKIFGSRRTDKEPSSNTMASRTYRDYGREALADPQNSDIVKGVELLCALDEQTCLTCLELDGAQNPPELPIHEGCRCVTLPVTKTFKDLGIDAPEFPEGDRASAIGPVAKNGGLYKQYLIQRACLAAKNLPNAAIATGLAAWLESASKKESDDGVVASIHLAIFAISTPKNIDEMRPILASVRWNAAGEHDYVFRACAEAGEYGVLTELLGRMANDVPDGPYSGRHRGMLYRSAAEAVKPFSLSSAIEFLIRAVDHDPLNVAVLVQLGSLQRRAGNSDQAHCTIEKALGGKSHSQRSASRA